MKITCPIHKIEFTVPDGCPECEAERQTRTVIEEARKVWDGDTSAVKSLLKAVDLPKAPDQPETTQVSLGEQIKVVAEARWAYGIECEAKKTSYEVWAGQNSILLSNLIKTEGEVKEAEALLRELTLKAYAETGCKNPAPGVGIREVIKLAYDTAEAFSWGTEHKMALKLDTLAFEKIVKASPLDFVKVTTEPQATIATNLDEARKG